MTTIRKEEESCFPGRAPPDKVSRMKKPSGVTGVGLGFIREIIRTTGT